MLFSEFLRNSSLEIIANQEKMARTLRVGLWAIAISCLFHGSPVVGAEPQSSEVLHGYVTPYNDRPRVATIAKRLEWGQIDQACAEIAHVALKMDHVGEKVWIKESNGQIFGPYCVFDLLNPAHADQVGDDYVGDVGREVWMLLESPQEITIYFKPPESSLPLSDQQEKQLKNLITHPNQQQGKSNLINTDQKDLLHQEGGNLIPADINQKQVQVLVEEDQLVSDTPDQQANQHDCQLILNKNTSEEHDFALKC